MLGSSIIRPDHDALHGSIVHGDLGIEALREGQPECHQPDDPNDDSGASSREPGLEGVDYGHVPARNSWCFYSEIGEIYTTKAARVKTHQDSAVGFIKMDILTGSRL